MLDLPLLDDFNRANGDPGANWQATDGGKLTISSNAVKAPDGATRYGMRWAGTPSSFGPDVAMRWRLPAGAGDVGMRFRYDGSSKWCGVDLSDQGSGALGIAFDESGVGVGGGAAVFPGTWVGAELLAILQGRKVTVYVNGGQGWQYGRAVEMPGGVLGADSVGISIGFDATVTIDDVRVATYAGVHDTRRVGVAGVA